MSNGSSSADREERIFLGYLKEYEECSESYRHTYQTIWQAAGLFGVISGALVGLGTQDGSVPPLIQVLAPAPLVFWYVGVFRPMNRYGEVRSARLAQLEQELEDEVPGLKMRHFRRYDTSRKAESPLYRIVTFKWVWRPRVSEIVTLLGVTLIIAEIVLVWTNYL